KAADEIEGLGGEVECSGGPVEESRISIGVEDAGVKGAAAEIDGRSKDVKDPGGAVHGHRAAGDAQNAGSISADGSIAVDLEGAAGKAQGANASELIAHVERTADGMRATELIEVAGAKISDDFIATDAEGRGAF